MKKTLPLIIAFATLLVFQSHAQFTVTVAGGYAFPGLLSNETIMGPKIDSKTANTDNLVPLANSSDKDSSYKPIHGSFGKGLNFTLGLGYQINPWVNVGMGFSFLQSANITATQAHEMFLYDEATKTFSSTGGFLNCNITTHAQGVSLMPSVTINGLKPGWKVYPYARIGLTLPIWGKLSDHITIDMDSAFASKQGLVNYVHAAPYFLGKHTEVTLETQGTISLGVNAALGVAYKPLPYLSIFFEVNGQYMNTRAKSSKITQWEADGVDQIPLRGVYRTQFTFVDQLNNKSNNGDFNSTIDPTKPKEDLRPNGPFSNVGFNLGITFYLSKKTLAKKDASAKAAEKSK